MDTNVLHNIGYGMYLVASSKGDSLNAQMVNSIIRVTSEPPTVAVSINKNNLTFEFIESSGIFAVSILEETAPLKFIGKFGFRPGRDTEKFKDVSFKKLASGCPVVLDNAVCYFAARVVDRLDCGTHVLFLAKVEDSEILKSGQAMSYEYYHNVKRGRTPKTAPTFIKEEII